MKRIATTFYLLTCVLVSFARADKQFVDGIEWTYRISNGEAEITKHSIPSTTAGDITIPTMLGNCPVTRIDNYAFHDCLNLTSVKIPDGVTSIGGGAFEGCYRLTSISIPDSVTSIGHGAFERCLWQLFDMTSNPKVQLVDGWAVGYLSDLCGRLDLRDIRGIAIGAFSKCSRLTSVTIPDNVTIIGHRAFEGCSSLMSVTIPDSITNIESSVFQWCSGLTSVTIPDSVTSIGTWAFCGCSGLTSVTIGNGVTSIGDWAFERCSGLTSVTIPDSVTSIGDWAFAESGLTTITIPDSVTHIGRGAFLDCSNLEETRIALIHPSAWTTNAINSDLSGIRRLFVGEKELTSVEIPDGVLEIGPSAFKMCSELKSVSIPDSVKYIGQDAFYGCTGLSSINIPNGMRRIGKSAFAGCSGLTSITIPDSVTVIEAAAFSDCVNLTEVKLPSGLKKLDVSVFKGCMKIQSVTYSDGRIYDKFLDCFPVFAKFASENSAIEYACIPSWGRGLSIDRPAKPVSGAIFLPARIGSDSVDAIGCYAFAGSSELKSVYIPEGVNIIGEGAFLNCRDLKSVVIPVSVMAIGPGAFQGCNLDTVTYPDGKIYDRFEGAFQGPVLDKMKTEREKLKAERHAEQKRQEAVLLGAEFIASLLPLALEAEATQQRQAKEAEREMDEYYRRQETAFLAAAQESDSARRAQEQREAERRAAQRDETYVICNECGGTGRDESGTIICQRCKGTGAVPAPR